jgi:hypothetical protein
MILLKPRKTGKRKNHSKTSLNLYLFNFCETIRTMFYQKLLNESPQPIESKDLSSFVLRFYFIF